MDCCSPTSTYLNPTTDEFKVYFARDFPFGVDPATSITDADLMKAFSMTIGSINPGLFCNQTAYTTGFLLLTAHYLVMNIRASSQGISGQFAWNQTSHSVGSVSESMQIPDRILANPEFAWLTKTNYGTQYLMSILPQLSGQMYTVYGRTNP